MTTFKSKGKRGIFEQIDEAGRSPYKQMSIQELNNIFKACYPVSPTESYRMDIITFGTAGEITKYPRKKLWKKKGMLE